jgi:hypothetical protein
MHPTGARRTLCALGLVCAPAAVARTQRSRAGRLRIRAAAMAWGTVELGASGTMHVDRTVDLTFNDPESPERALLACLTGAMDHLGDAMVVATATDCDLVRRRCRSLRVSAGAGPPRPWGPNVELLDAAGILAGDRGTAARFAPLIDAVLVGPFAQPSDIVCARAKAITMSLLAVGALHSAALLGPEQAIDAVRSAVAVVDADAALMAAFKELLA